jgi:hypothetical protein
MTCWQSGQWDRGVGVSSSAGLTVLKTKGVSGMVQYSESESGDVVVSIFANSRWLQPDTKNKRNPCMPHAHDYTTPPPLPPSD